METFEYYKDYGIRYCQIGGTTSVEYYGLVLKSFPGIGMIDGEEAAKKFIDKICVPLASVYHH